MTPEQERQALVGELTTVALRHVRQNSVIETAQAELKKIAAEERRILKQLDTLDADIKIGNVRLIRDTDTESDK